MVSESSNKNMDWVKNLPPDLQQDILDTEAKRNLVGPFASVDELFEEIGRRYKLKNFSKFVKNFS